MPLTLTKCADGLARSKFPDGDAPVITGVTGSLTNGSTINIAGTFSAKNPAGFLINKFSTPDQAGQLWCPSYVHTVDPDDFFGLGATAIAQTQVGSTWAGEGTPVINHAMTDEFFYTYLYKIEFEIHDAQGPDWVNGETYAQGQFARRPSAHISGYTVYEKTSAGSLVSTVAPESDLSGSGGNWTAVAAPQIKMQRQLVKDDSSDHYGVFGIINQYDSDKVLPPAADSCISARGEAVVVEAPATGTQPAGTAGTIYRDNVFEKWCRVISYYKKDPGTGKGSHFYSHRNLEDNVLFFEFTYGGGSGNPGAMLNDKTKTAPLPPFFEPRFVFDNNFTVEFDGVGDQFWMPFYKRSAAKFICKAQGLVANDSWETVWLVNSLDVDAAIASGKAHPLPQQSRGTSLIAATYYEGNFTPADDKYLVVYNSNGKYGEPWPLAEGV